MNPPTRLLALVPSMSATPDALSHKGMPSPQGFERALGGASRAARARDDQPEAEREPEASAPRASLPAAVFVLPTPMPVVDGEAGEGGGGVVLSFGRRCGTGLGAVPGAFDGASGEPGPSRGPAVASVGTGTSGAATADETVLAAPATGGAPQPGETDGWSLAAGGSVLAGAMRRPGLGADVAHPAGGARPLDGDAVTLVVEAALDEALQAGAAAPAEPAPESAPTTSAQAERLEPAAASTGRRVVAPGEGGPADGGSGSGLGAGGGFGAGGRAGDGMPRGAVTPSGASALDGASDVTGAVPSPLSLPGASSPTASGSATATASTGRAVPTSAVAHVPAAIVEAARSEVSTLTVSMSPKDLGHVRVTLRATSEGLVVSVRSDPLAHAALQDLSRVVRSQLEAAGMTLAAWQVTAGDTTSALSDRPDSWGQSGAEARSGAEDRGERPAGHAPHGAARQDHGGSPWGEERGRDPRHRPTGTEQGLGHPTDLWL